ncbi:MAG: glycoside hydrolase family 38 C-terminal domain-containing protein [Bacteroidales bacterium]
MSTKSIFSKKFCLFFLAVYLFSSLSFGQSNLPFRPSDSLINGYFSDLAGEVLNYHSCHPEATTSLLIRSLNNTDYIEWQTDPVKYSKNRDTLIFCWIGGFSTGTSTADHIFHLSVDGDEKLSFRTVPKMPHKGWSVNGKDGYRLDFMFVKEDHVLDHFGYFFLKVPNQKVASGKTLKIRVTGDGSGSRDWYMTMRYSLKQRLTLLPEEAILKGDNNKPFQRLKISLDHYSHSEEAEIKLDGESTIKTALQFGVNEFIVPVVPVTASKDLEIIVESPSHKVTSVIPIHPVRSYRVFLLPHSHVDIGYTDVQTEIARIHAMHVRKAMQLISATENYPEGSRFKWNVEMLWEAESFLQYASKKEKEDFFAMVKRGSIGLEGMYAGVMTGLCREEELFHLFDYKYLLEQEHGLNINTAMITDIPGYVWGLIPVMAQSGIRYFSIGPNMGDRIGNTISAWGDKPFWWVSPSGKEKVLSWMSSRGYSLFHRGSLAKTDGSQVLDYLADLSRNNYPYDLVQLRYTVGGDNGYPDSLLADYVRDWNRKYLSPVLEISVTRDMFQQFELKYGGKLPSYSGDFSPYWEDGAASTAKETAANRWSAEKLVQAGTLWAMNNPEPFPEKDFYAAWNHVLLYSEHTWGAWNSTSDPDLQNVKDQWEIKRGFAESGELLSDLLMERALRVNKDNQEVPEQVTVFNTNSWVRNGLIYIPAQMVRKNYNGLSDQDGNAFKGQLLSNGLMAFPVKNIPPLGKKGFRFVNVKAKEDQKMIAGPLTLENEFISIRLDSLTGDIISLTDKRTLREWVDQKAGKGLHSYWYSGQNAINPVPSGKTLFKVMEKGPLVVKIQTTSAAPGCEKIIREISLVRGDDRVYLRTHVFKKAIREKENVRFAFPFQLTDPEVRMDMAWFTLEAGKNQLPGSNMNYYTVQRWIDVSNDQEGITLATPDAPLWEIGNMTAESWMRKEGNLWMEKPMNSSVLYSWVMNNSWHTNFKADQEGEVVFQYVLSPHDGFSPVNAYRFGVEVSQPLIWVPGISGGISPALPEIIPDERIVVTSVTPLNGNKNEFIYRFYNAGQNDIKYIPFGVNVSIKECHPNGTAKSGYLNHLEFTGNEIKTVRVTVN